MRAAKGAAPGLRRPRRTAGDKAVAATSHGLLSLWTAVVIVPFAWTLMSSFKTSAEILASPFSLPTRLSLDNYISAWSQAGIGSYFFNTVVVVGSALALVMLLGAMCAYVLARYPFPGNRLIYGTMLAAMSFPLFLAIVPLFFVLRRLALLNTLPGLTLTYVAFALPFTVFFLHAFFEQLPQDVYEAALVDGAGEWRTFFWVMLPMAAPGLSSVAILNFIGLWNQFMLPIVFNTKRDNWVLTQGLTAFANATGRAVDYGAMFAAVVMTIIPVLVVYVVFQRRLEGSVSQGTFR
ncbi:MAG: carbohydrate ABC transporter permease [Bifidobacteriaceae bacterium]|jgi:N-acetylglucosamine transport system permease protein|nr:carbohydrate ABC transporter permease [Bifidobacteriaceae bacterium]